ncbi:MAG: hypothetical protein PHN88_08140 [Ignavibacteria bacterium]|nr:hypothetical protein [Ignavibacteria bacterium]
MTGYSFKFNSNNYIHRSFGDSLKLDINKISAYALDGDIPSALNLLKDKDTSLLSVRDKMIKRNFENRFLYVTDRSGYLESKKSEIDDVLKIFSDYWRSSFLNPKLKNDSLLAVGVKKYLVEKSPLPVSFNQLQNDDTLNAYFIKYINTKGLKTTGVGKTGKFYDLLVWREQSDTVYNFQIHDETISVNVVFMDKFVTLGWEEYATFGMLYPGGWANDKALYCVRSAYDLQSENFLVSYLAHEGRHYQDYKLFPKLSGADLEYRAKLTELSLAKTSLFGLIKFFITNANYSSDNSHQIANFCVIRDLSKELFASDFENDIAKWENTGAEKINDAAFKILKENTAELTKIGKDAEKFIKSGK